MCDYSVYEKNITSKFVIENPKPKEIHQKISFNIKLLNRSVKIFINKDSSLEDLYTQIYNKVYPEFSTEKNQDTIPPNTYLGYNYVPKIYAVAIVNKDERFVDIPLHKFITISAFMKCNAEFFTNTAFFGTPTFKIFVIDEFALNKMQQNKDSQSTNYFKKYIRCFTNDSNNSH